VHIKYPETNDGYKAWVKAKEEAEEAEEAAKREAVTRGKSTTVVHVLHWTDLNNSTMKYNNLHSSGKKFFLTYGEALKWTEEHFTERDCYDKSLLNIGKWKIVATDSGNIVEFDPFFWDYNQFNSQEVDFWLTKIRYNYNDDDFYTQKDEAITKILWSKAFNLGLGVKLSMKKCGMFNDSDVM
jgi:hypothetical protein